MRNKLLEENKMKRKNLAFSMAEVMITLVILGVVAILTVPGLVDSANKRINEAAESKADYVIGQAALRLQAECPRLRCTDARTKLSSLLESVKANEKLTYGVSAYDSTNKKIYVVVVIEGDDIPILFAIDNKGKGAMAVNNTCGASISEATTASTKEYNGNMGGKTIKNNSYSSVKYRKITGTAGNCTEIVATLTRS